MHPAEIKEVADLANVLIDAKTKEERAQLLKDNKNLVTAELVRELYNKGDTQAKQGKFAEALKLNDIAFEVAQVLGDKAQLASCYVYRGLIFWYQARYPAALENYQKALVLARGRRPEAA